MDDIINENQEVVENLSSSCNTTDDVECYPENVEMKYVDQETQVDFLDTNEYIQKIFVCNLYVTLTNFEAQTQTNGPAPDTKIIIQLPPKEDCDVVSGLFGFFSIKREQELIDLCGTSMKAFNLLLKLLQQNIVEFLVFFQLMK